MPQARHIVRRRNWRWAPGNEHTPRGWVCFPGPGTAVAEFDFFDDAEHDWGKREAAVRLKMNPFECGPLIAVSSLPEPIFRDFLMDTGIVPPPVGTPWDAWWAATREQLSDEQRARVWEAADKVRFFEITEEAAGSEVHVVVDVQWEERDGIHVAEFDGGHLIRACRHVQRAGEIARGRANQQRMQYSPFGEGDAPFANCRPSNVRDPFTPGSTRLGTIATAPFSEVVTIPFDETSDGVLPRTDEVFLVVRVDYAPSSTTWDVGMGAGIPLKAFADWERVCQFASELALNADSSFNPFRLARTPGGLDYPGKEGHCLQACRDLGHPLPDDQNWELWWNEHIVPLPRAKQEKLLQQIAFPFFNVATVPFEASP